MTSTRILRDWSTDRASVVVRALCAARAWEVLDDELDSVPVEMGDPGACAGWYIGFLGSTEVRQRASFERLLRRAQDVADYDVRAVLLGEPRSEETPLVKDGNCNIVVYGRTFGFGGHGDETAASVAFEAVKCALAKPGALSAERSAHELAEALFAMPDVRLPQTILHANASLAKAGYRIVSSPKTCSRCDGYGCSRCSDPHCRGRGCRQCAEGCE